MTRGESIRASVVFGVLGLGVLAILARLVDLQIVRATGAASAIALRTQRLPAPRGELLDRFGGVLAWDRPVYEVRATAEVFAGFPDHDHPLPDRERLARTRDKLVAELVWALGKDRARFGTPDARDALRAVLVDRVERAATRAFERNRRAVDLLVERTLDSAEAIAALRELDVRRTPPKKGEVVAYRLYLDFQPRWEREYASGDALTGLIGRVQPGPLRMPAADGEPLLVDDRIPVSGLERLVWLLPRESGHVSSRADVLARPYWTADRKAPARPLGLCTTLDPALQIRADEELALAAEAIRAKYEHPPEWGALVLVDVRDGGVVAAASYTAAKDGTRERNSAFAPAQRLFEPGSVVKPLQLAMVLERGLVDWNRPVDCRKGYLAGSNVAPPGVRMSRREIRDDHPSEFLAPHDVLVRSSNIGAVQLGLRLGAAGIEDYLQAYRFGDATAVRFPGELAGSRPAAIPSLSLNEQLVFAGPSVLFGYQIAVTPLQLARAFLSFLSGRARELHVVAAARVDGETHALPAAPPGERFLSQSTLAEVRSALVDVVEDPHGTAREVGKWLRDLRTRTGRTDLRIAGKTGTSQYRGATKKWNGEPFHGDIRTASFVGFTPVDEPRFLVVCVFQKAGAGAFYGGLYAAPAAARLLVASLERETAAWRTASDDGSASVDVAIGSEPGGSDHFQRR